MKKSDLEDIIERHENKKSRYLIDIGPFKFWYIGKIRTFKGKEIGIITDREALELAMRSKQHEPGLE